jgi:nucleoside-diphosphate-sugar epimerase
MKLLVTGATGFVGRRLCARLLRDGAEVHAVIRPTTNRARLADARLPAVVDDGSAATLGAYVRGRNFDAVVHLAALFLAEHKPEQVGDLIAANVLFAARVLEAAAAAGIPRFLNTGTAWQHFRGDAYLPVNLYAASKQAFADLARFYEQTSPVYFTTLMLNDTYGPGDERPKLLNRWDQISRTGEALDLSPGEQRLDLVHVDDVAEAYCRLLALTADDPERRHAGREFALHAEKLVTLRELAGLFTRATGRALNVRWGGRPYRAREIMNPWPGGEPLPGWKPRIGLEVGLRQAYGA